jgi:hypothetical protein
MSLDLLVKSSAFKCEGPAVGRAYFADLRISGMSRIWLWKAASLQVSELASQLGQLLCQGKKAAIDCWTLDVSLYHNGHIDHSGGG